MTKKSVGKYRVTLSDADRTKLQQLIRSGTTAARTLAHARILLKADTSPGQPGWDDAQIHDALDVSLPTISRVRKTYVVQGLDAALTRKPAARHKARLLDGAQEAHLVALACSQPPDDQDHWTLRLLAERMVELEYVPALSHETVRRTLKKTNSSRG
jgi:transposase